MPPPGEAAKRRLSSDFWPCKTGPPGHAHASPHAGAPIDGSLWSWRGPGSYDAPLLDAEGYIYLVRRTEAVVKCRTDLMLSVQRFDVKGVLATPALHGGVIYAATEDGHAVALDFNAPARERWKRKFCGACTQDPWAVGFSAGTVILSGSEAEPEANSRTGMVFADMVYGLDAKDGKTNWRYKPSMIMQSQNFTPAFIDDFVLFATSKGDVCCLWVKDGKEHWSAVPKGYSKSSGGVAVGKNRIAYVAANLPGKRVWNHPAGGKGIVRAYELRNGSLKWDRPFDMEANGIPSLLPTGPGGKNVLVVGLGAIPGFREGNRYGQPVLGDQWAARLVGLDPENGEQLWATDPLQHKWPSSRVHTQAQDQDIQITPWSNPVGGADGTFYTVWQGQFFQFSVERGQFKGHLDLWDGVQAPVVVGPGMLVVAGVTARVSVFRAPGAQGLKVVRPLDRPLEETGPQPFWACKHGNRMDNQGYTKDPGVRSLLKPAAYWDYAGLYADAHRVSDDNLYNSPAIDAHRNIYIAANLSDLFIVRPDGRLRGSVFCGPLTSTPVFIGRSCYIVNGCGYAISFDIESLEYNWQVRYCVSNPWDSWSLCGVEGALIAGGNMDFRQNGATHLFRLDTRDGRICWEYPIPWVWEDDLCAPYNMIPGITAEGVVVIANMQGVVFGINLEDGSLRWKTAEHCVRGNFSTSTVVCAPCGLAADGFNSPGAPDTWNYNQGGKGRLVVLETDKGEEKWRRDFKEDLNVAPLFLPPEAAVGSDGWQVVVLLASNPGPPRDHNDPVSGNEWAGLMISMDAETSATVWTWSPPPNRRFTFRGSDPDDWYLPDGWTSASSDKHGVVYASFIDGVMYAVKGGQLVSVFDARCCANSAPAIAPGLVVQAFQFGLLIWRDEKFEQEWSVSDDPRAAGGVPPGGPIPAGGALGGPWEGEGSLEWLPRPWKKAWAPKAAAEDRDAWLKQVARCQEEGVQACVKWSENRRTEVAAATKAVGGAKAPAVDRPQGKEGSVWVVVGGGDRGGIVARSGEGLKSPELPRLQTGATVEEIELKGDRLHYKKLTGDGPDFGWVSLAFKGTPLVRRDDT